MAPQDVIRQNANFNHIGVAVTSVDAAVEWYSRHFGFRSINSVPIGADRSQDPENAVFRIYGGKLQKVKIAFLTTGNGVGFEVFEFIDPPTRKYDKETWTLDEQYQRGGYFHIALTVAEVDKKCEDVCKDGAEQIGETTDLPDGHKALYFKDPWGNVVELMTGSWEECLANRW